MKWRCLAATTMVIVFLAGFGVFWVTRPLPVPEPNFEWGVHIGDTFRYQLRTHATYPWSLMFGVSNQTYEDILGLNGTTVVANMTSLPLLDGVFDSSTFFSAIVNVSRVDCVLANGSELQNAVEGIIASAPSGCILPIGGLPFIDSLYPDETPWFPPYPGSFASKVYPDHFFFAHIQSNGIDAMWGWPGNITLSDGVPTSVQWKNTHQYFTVYIDLILAES